MNTGHINIYKLTEMGKILPKYFRHSEYKSFLRQLTSYGFYRKMEKTDVETQYYINIETSNDMQSILRLKVNSITIMCRQFISSKQFLVFVYVLEEATKE